MPLISKEYIDDDCLLGVWKIKEDFDSLYSQVELNPGEEEALFNFKSPERRVEWLSVRKLLKDMSGLQEEIIYNEKRKPFLKSNNYHISISHSNNITAILLSKTKKVGLDLEYMSHRISSIRHKFINDKEYIVDDESKVKYHLYIHWCAKEALYKICDKQDINFLKNLTIEPFEPAECGLISGWVDNKYWNEKFDIKYYQLQNYIVAYCYKLLDR